MITPADIWLFMRTKPFYTIWCLAVGALIGCVAQHVEETHKRCASSDARGYVYTVCEK